MTQTQLDEWRSELPELPRARRERFVRDYGLPEYDAEVLTAEKDFADYFEAAVRAYHQPKKISNWMMSELLRELNLAKLTPGECMFRPAAMAKLVQLVEEGAISMTTGKQIFPDLFAIGTRDPEDYCKEKGLVQISDSAALEAAVDEVIAANPAEAERFRGGEKKLMGFLMGQVMRKTKGQANPQLVSGLINKKLS